MGRTETKTSSRAVPEGAKLASTRTGFRRFCRSGLWSLLKARRLALIAYQRTRIRELERENATLHARLAIPHDRKARRRLERTVRKAVTREVRRARLGPSGGYRGSDPASPPRPPKGAGASVNRPSDADRG